MIGPSRVLSATLLMATKCRAVTPGGTACESQLIFLRSHACFSASSTCHRSSTHRASRFCVMIMQTRCLVLPACELRLMLACRNVVFVLVQCDGSALRAGMKSCIASLNLDHAELGHCNSEQRMYDTVV